MTYTVQVHNVFVFWLCPCDLQALGVLHEECVSVKMKTQQKKLQSSMLQLLQSVQTSCCPSYSAAVLLRALSHVNGQVRAGTHLHMCHFTWITFLTAGWPPCLLFLSGRPVCPASCSGSAPGAEPRHSDPAAIRGPADAAPPGEVQRGVGPPAVRGPELSGSVYQSSEDLNPETPRHPQLPDHCSGTGQDSLNPGLKKGLNRGRTTFKMSNVSVLIPELKPGISQGPDQAYINLC